MTNTKPQSQSFQLNKDTVYIFLIIVTSIISFFIGREFAPEQEFLKTARENRKILDSALVAEKRKGSLIISSMRRIITSVDSLYHYQIELANAGEINVNIAYDMLKKIEGFVVESRTEIDRLNQNLNTSEEENRGLRREIEELKAKIQAQIEEINKKKQMLRQHRGRTIVMNDPQTTKMIQNLRGTVSNLNSRIVQYQKQLAQKDIQIAQQGKTIYEQNTQLTKKNTKINSLTDNLADAKEDIKEQQEQTEKEKEDKIKAQIQAFLDKGTFTTRLVKYENEKIQLYKVDNKGELKPFSGVLGKIRKSVYEERRKEYKKALNNYKKAYDLSKQNGDLMLGEIFSEVSSRKKIYYKLAEKADFSDTYYSTVEMFIKNLP